MSHRRLSYALAITLGLGLFLFGFSLSVSSVSAASCVNPSPIPSGYAAPCPVLSLSSYSITASGPLSLTLAPNAASQYIWGTVYLYNGSSWVPLVVSSNYLTATTNYTIPASDLSSLSQGTYYIASWDWTWNQSQGCYVGPGSTTCSTGEWRVQEFAVTGGGGGGGGNYSLTNQQPPSMPAYFENADSLTTKQLPADAMQHCYGNTSNCSTGDAIAKCALTDCGGLMDTPIPQAMGTIFFASPGNSDNEDAVYYSAATDPWGSVVASTPSGNQTITFRYPSGAKFPEGSPAGSGNECQITVWDQSTGWAVGFYRSGSCGGGTTLPVASGCGSTQATACSIPTGDVSASANLLTAQDYNYHGSGGTSAQSSDEFAPAAGLLRQQELMSNTIDHTLIFTVDCVNANVFPAPYGFLGPCGTSYFGPKNASRAPAGALLFLDYTPAQLTTICASVPAWQCTMLTAFSKYGGYVGITSGAGGTLTMRGNEEIESSEAWKYYYPSTFLTQDPFWAWANGQKGLDGSFNLADTGCFSGSGANPSTYRCEGAILSNIARMTGPEGTDVEGNSCTTSPGCYPSGHIHMADPCIAEGYADQSGACH